MSGASWEDLLKDKFEDWAWLCRPPWWRPFKRRAFDREIREKGVGFYCARFVCSRESAAAGFPGHPMAFAYRRPGRWARLMQALKKRRNEETNNAKVCADERAPLPPEFMEPWAAASQKLTQEYLDYMEKWLRENEPKGEPCCQVRYDHPWPGWVSTVGPENVPQVVMRTEEFEKLVGNKETVDED